MEPEDPPKVIGEDVPVVAVGDPPPAVVGGEPMGVADAPLSPEDAQKGYDAVMAALKATPGTKKEVTIDGKPVTLYEWAEPRLIVSESCAPGGTVGTCKALDGLKTSVSAKIDIGVGNPSAYYCASAGGKSVNATSTAGEDGMCQFDDGSVISDWSLVYVGTSIRAALTP